MLSFKGLVTAELLSSILHIMESKLTHLQEDSKLKKKVFNVLVECLQNLYHHIDVHEDDIKEDIELLDKKSAVFMIARFGGSFYVRTGNYVENKDATKLMRRLDKINSLDKEELRLYYQEILGNGGRSGKGTAGLGMIDIARKSGNKLEYEFVQVTEDIKFFCLNVKID
ncbi:MAG: SiaB family protein kinase [Bacteroidetes bacterium]|nr:SiaB family protein kinase [Bacteroidota bacterium]